MTRAVRLSRRIGRELDGSPGSPRRRARHLDRQHEAALLARLHDAEADLLRRSRPASVCADQPPPDRLIDGLLQIGVLVAGVLHRERGEPLAVLVLDRRGADDLISDLPFGGATLTVTPKLITIWMPLVSFGSLTGTCETLNR